MAPAPPSDRALPPPGPLVIRGGYVQIAGGQIVAVGPDLAVPAGTPELDAADMIVAPGLVDTHWHMWNTLLRSMSADPSGPGYFKVMIGAGRAYGPGDIYASTRLACAEEVSSGLQVVHANCATGDEVAALAAAGAQVTISPHSELLIGYGLPRTAEFLAAAR